MADWGLRCGIRGLEASATTLDAVGPGRLTRPGPQSAGQASTMSASGAFFFTEAIPFLAAAALL